MGILSYALYLIHIMAGKVIIDHKSIFI